MASGSFTLDAQAFLAGAMNVRMTTLPESGRILKQFADEAMADAKSRVDEFYTAHGAANPSGPNPGELADSGRVEDPQYTGTTVSVEASFGKDGPASEYALHVHEGHHLVAWGHDTNIDLPPAKYWETPLMEAVNAFEERVGRPIGVVIERAWGGR